MIKKIQRLLIVAAMVLTLLVMFAAFMHHHGRKSELPRSNLKGSFPVIADRLEKQIEKLTKESATESIAKLSDVNLFYWPGPGVDGGFGMDLPLPKEEGHLDITAIMSNRRFRKVFEELASMDKKAASQSVHRALSAGVEEYLPLYAEMMQRSAPRYTLEVIREDIKHHRSITSPTFDIGNVPEGKVVISGARLNVLALVWIAGMLELSECREDVERVARVALKQRNDLYNEPTLDSGFKRDMLHQACLYNRQLICSGLLGVNAPGNSILRTAGVEWRERQLTGFKSVVTEFDVPVRMRILAPDFSQGGLKVRFVAPMSDADFDKLLQSMRISTE